MGALATARSCWSASSWLWVTPEASRLEQDEENEGLRGQCGRLAQHLVEGQLIEPRKAHAVREWLQRLAKGFRPVALERGVAEHDGNVVGVRRQLEDVLDQAGDVGRLADEARIAARTRRPVACGGSCPCRGWARSEKADAGTSPRTVRQALRSVPPGRVATWSAARGGTRRTGPPCPAARSGPCRARPGPCRPRSPISLVSVVSKAVEMRRERGRGATEGVDDEDALGCRLGPGGGTGGERQQEEAER